MSIDPFPEHVTPRKLCDRNGTINSFIPLGKLLRLSEYLDDLHGQAEVCLSFDRDESGHCRLSGDVCATVSLRCQRCLEPVAVTLQSTLAIKLASSEAEGREMAEHAADSLDELDVVVCAEGELDLLSVIEDELIMSLPIVATHDNARCNEAFNTLHAADAQQLEKATRQSNIKGLDVLEKLKQELAQERNEVQENTDNESNKD